MSSICIAEGRRMITMGVVKSPLPGVFYRRPSPDKEPYAVEGQVIRSGDVIGIIEVMKNYFQIKADVDGKLIRFVVQDGELVDIGQVIAECEDLDEEMSGGDGNRSY